MKKFVLIFVSLSLVIASKTKVYLNYANDLVNYNFELKGFNKIKEPFEQNNTVAIINGKEVKSNQILTKSIKKTPLLIFDNKAYIDIKEYLGGQLIKEYKKWVKKGDKIGKCKVFLVTFDKVIFSCRGKKEIKTLNKKTPQIKEMQ